MLKAPPQRVLQGLRRLSQTDADFQLFLEWLEANREDQVRTLCLLRDQWVTAQHQGSVQVLTDIHDAVIASRQ